MTNGRPPVLSIQIGHNGKISRTSPRLIVLDSLMNYLTKLEAEAAAQAV